MDSILRRNFTYLFILQNANYIFPLILLPYLTRVLGAENFGKISFTQAFIAYFVLLTEYGFNTSATQDVVHSRENKDKLSRVFWSTTLTKLIFASISFFILCFLTALVPKLYDLRILLSIAYTGVLSSLLFPVWLFQGLEKMICITWFNVIPKFLVLILVLLFVKTKSDYVLALFLQSGGVLLSSLISAWYIYKQKIVYFYLPSRDEIRSTAVDGWHIFVSGLATNFYTTTNLVVLGFFSSNAIVGIFSASEKIIRAIISLLSSISQVTFPRINSYYKESKERALIFGGKLLRWSSRVTLITGVLLFLLAPIIVQVLFGLPQYEGTISIIRISSLLPFFAINNGILAVNILVTFGLKEHLLKIVGGACVFSLILIIPAVMLYQAQGVAWVAVLTEIMISYLLFNLLRRKQIRIKLI